MSSTDEKATDSPEPLASDARPDGALAEFSQAFLRRLPDAYLEAQSDEAVFAQVESVFSFVEHREGDALHVRVFQPTLETDGYEADGTVVEVNVNDSPFIVDSVTGAIEALGQAVVTEAHAVVGVVRSPGGRLTDVTPARSAEHREAIQHYQLKEQLTGEAAARLEEALSRVLADVQAAVRDFGAMRAVIDRMKEVARDGAHRYSDRQVDEAEAFLDWMLDLNFIFLGYREYGFEGTGPERTLSVVPGTGLGILGDVSSSRFATPVAVSALPPDLAERYEDGFLVVISKTNRVSTVHRRDRMDYIGVRHIGPDGSVVGEARMVGLFTSRAYMSEAAGIPILRGKLGQVLEEDDLIEGSHDHKAMVQLFNSFPKDELWSMSVDHLRTSIHALQASAERERVRLFVNPDMLERSVSLLVVMPRDRFSASLRRKLQRLFLERFEGSNVDYQLSLGEGGPARIHFTVWVAGGRVPDVPFEPLQQQVVELSRTWEDRLTEVVAERYGPAGDGLVEQWAPRIPDYYKASTRLEIAAGDLALLEKLSQGESTVAVGLQNDTHPSDPLTRLAVLSRGGKLELSAILPILEALGLRVVEEVPTRLIGEGGDILIHDFGVRGPAGGLLDLDACATRVAQAVVEVLESGAEFDTLDRLITSSRLDRRQVGILRAYRTYWRRVRPRFTNDYMNDALVEHSHLAEQLVQLFEHRFDPQREEENGHDVREAILSGLDGVRSLDQDLILRAMVELIDATVRTNAYQPDRGYLSLKLRSADVPDMPEPYPLYEVYVHAPDVEGIHLRGGPVARGGIRWSSRLEDYRTEVLGLMKAQRTKNAIIVPGGAKGGFVLRRPPTADGLAAAVTGAYSTYIRGLLDVTDNLVAGRSVRPDGVRAHDDDDPYLVVAADRGTARLSDTANGIAEEYGFWLGDAFASGGSSGYDHKALGITAKGAWESVKRHFHDLGTDVGTTAISVVGIGDMSGDVFGNGMLQSDQIQLIAAFDHRHIFIDPTPDTRASFAERLRLYELPGSSWDDYDRSIISEGGGVYRRDAKRIELSDEAGQALELDAESLTPAALVRAILLAPVDMLWNGGIGTYVKAATETDAEADDRSNDTVRVNGESLRCWVVGEGGNLGFTQRGRIEYAARGGRINSDFIDNSGGVDCSDREVNLKILLRLAQERGDLAPEDRSGVIAAVTGDVTERVIYDNFLQAQILSQEAGRSADNLDSYDDLMKVLEDEGMLDRAIEYVPSSEELAERSRERRGLERPELAVLLAYAKRWLRLALLRSDVPDGFEFANDLMEYFPEPIVKRFGHLAADHPLRREIIATRVANRVVNSEGITFVSRLGIETGASPAEVVRAYQAALTLTGAEERWAAVERLDASVGPQVRGELMNGVDQLVESLTRWYLRQSSVAAADASGPARMGFDELASVIHMVGPADWRAGREEAVSSLTESGVPEEVARRHAYQAKLAQAPDILELAALSHRPIADVADVFFLVGETYKLDWLEARASQLPTESRWERWAVLTLQHDVLRLRRDLAERVLASAEIQNGTALVEYFRSTRPDEHDRLREFLSLLSREGGGDLNSLIVAARQIASVLG